ncbi:hypothetical protein KJ599_05180 [bacterium]|nr:hypothetical protein [bacterium]
MGSSIFNIKHKTEVTIMDGTQRQVLKIIGILKGIKAEELAAIMMVPTKYIDEVCQSLLEDGVIIKSAERDGFVLKYEVRDEATKLIESLRVVYAEEISEKLVIPLELAKYICESSLKDGFLYRTPRGGYLLEEDRKVVLKTIREFKEVKINDISKKLGLTIKHVKLLCKSLMDDYSILKNSKGKFILAEKDETRLLRIVREYGWAPIGRIVHKMKITSAYADLLCRSLAEKGYLKKGHPEAYALVGRKNE